MSNSFIIRSHDIGSLSCASVQTTADHHADELQSFMRDLCMCMSQRREKIGHELTVMERANLPGTMLLARPSACCSQR